MSDEFCHTWDYITDQYELVLHSEVLPDDAGKEESEYNSRSRSRKRSIVIPDNAEYTPVTRTEYELTYYVNNVNTNNTQVLMEYDENGTLKNSYTYGNERISIDSEEEKDYYLYDGRGSVSQVVNADEIVETYTYDPFGNVTGGAPDFESFYGYNAEETNPVTGLQYLRARYYDSATGRFSTADSYLGDVTNPLTLNRYIYTLNNPMMYNDPSGHFALTALLIGAAVAATAAVAVGLTGDTRKEEKDILSSESVNNTIPQKSDIKKTYIPTSRKLSDTIAKNESYSQLWKNESKKVVENIGNGVTEQEIIDKQISDLAWNSERKNNQLEEAKTELEEMESQRKLICENLDELEKQLDTYNELFPNAEVPSPYIINTEPFSFTREEEKAFDLAVQGRIMEFISQEEYSQAKWMRYSPIEKNERLKILTEYVCKQLGIEICGLLYDNIDSVGAFNGEYMIINIGCLDPKAGKQVLKTVIHELRHAYQNAVIDNPNLYVVSEETRMVWYENTRIEGNYIRLDSETATTEEWNRYYAQPVEWDARNFAMQYEEIKDIDRDLITYEGSWLK